MKRLALPLLTFLLLAVAGLQGCVINPVPTPGGLSDKSASGGTEGVPSSLGQDANGKSDGTMAPGSMDSSADASASDTSTLDMGAQDMSTQDTSTDADATALPDTKKAEACLPGFACP